MALAKREEAHAIETGNSHSTKAGTHVRSDNNRDAYTRAVCMVFGFAQSATTWRGPATTARRQRALHRRQGDASRLATVGRYAPSDGSDSLLLGFARATRDGLRPRDRFPLRSSRGRQYVRPVRAGKYRVRGRSSGSL